MGDTATEYRTPLGTPFVLLVIGLLGAVAVVITVGTLSGQISDGPPWWFLMLFCLAWAWNAYIYLFTVATTMRLEGTTFVWAAPLRRGRVPVTDLAQVRPFLRLSNQVLVVKGTDGRRITGAMNGRGMHDFLNSLTEANPRVEIDV